MPVMSEPEYQAIAEALKLKAEARRDMVYDQASRESAKRLILLLHFLSTYGLRIGDVLTVRLEHGRRFSYRQKGGDVRHKALRSASKQILAESGHLKRLPFRGMAKSSVRGWALRRLTVELAGLRGDSSPLRLSDIRQ